MNDVKEALYKAFNIAVKHQAEYKNPDSSSNGSNYGGGNPMNFAIENRLAIGTLAQAIVALEHEQHEAAESKPRTLDKHPALTGR